MGVNVEIFELEVNGGHGGVNGVNFCATAGVAAVPPPPMTLLIIPVMIMAVLIILALSHH